MAELIGQHQQTTFVDPQNGQDPIDADQVRTNDNTLRVSYNAHDNNRSVHFQSGTTGERPAAGNLGAKYLDRTTKRIYVDDGAQWVEVNGSSIPASQVTAAAFPAGAFSFTTSVASPIITASSRIEMTGGQAVAKRTDGGNSGANQTVDWDVSQIRRLRLTANCTLDFTNGRAGATYYLELMQDGTGSRTVVHDADVVWGSGGAPTLTTTANRKDILGFYYNGLKYIGFVVETGINDGDTA